MGPLTVSSHRSAASTTDRYCIDVNDDVDEEELRCVECYSDINCPAGYFCAKSDYPEIDGYDAARRWQVRQR